MKTIGINEKDKKSEKNILEVEGINARGYGIIQKLVMQDRNLTRDAKCIYAYLRSFAGAGSTAFPSIAKIREDLSFGSEETFYLHINYLKAYGYVVVNHRYSENGKIQTNVYKLPENPVPNLEYLERVKEFKEKVKRKNDKKNCKEPIKLVLLIIGDIPDYRSTDNQSTDNRSTNNNTDFKNNISKINTIGKNNTHTTRAYS